MTVGEILGRMRALPAIDLDDIGGGARLLILAPHQDDESLGCGGLIAASCEAGRPPVVVFVTDGAKSHPRSESFPPARLRVTRESEARAALVTLGLTTRDIRFLRLPDTAAPHDGAMFDAAVDSIVATAQAEGCGAIAAPWRHDPHCDHLAAHLMAEAVAKRLAMPHVAYPVWGWTLPPDDDLEDDVRGGRLDISLHIARKRQAIAAHISQHGKLILDDPTGFVLPHRLLRVFDQPYEVFLTQ